MAVPRSAPVMPLFCRKAGRSSAVWRAAWVTSLTLTLTGTSCKASSGLCQAKFSSRAACSAASGAGGGGASGPGSASGASSTRMASGAALSPWQGRKSVFAHSAPLSGWRSAAVSSQPDQLWKSCRASGPVMPALAYRAGALRAPAASFNGRVMNSASCARVRATYKMRISSLRVSVRMVWESAA